MFILKSGFNRSIASANLPQSLIWGLKVAVCCDISQHESLKSIYIYNHFLTDCSLYMYFDHSPKM